MKRWILALPLVLVIAGGTVIGLQYSPGSAASVGRASGDSGSRLATATVLSQRAAQKAASVALADCSKRGFPVAATVVDPDGIVIVTLRADHATGATIDVSTGKAYAAAGFKSPTSGLQEAAKTNPGFISLPGFVILPGGLPVFSGGRLVAGIGVSGAPSGDIDTDCANAGLRAIGLAH